MINDVFFLRGQSVARMKELIMEICIACVEELE